MIRDKKPLNNIFDDKTSFPKGIDRFAWLRLSAEPPILDIGCGEIPRFTGMSAVYIDDWSDILVSDYGYFREGTINDIPPFDGTVDGIERVRREKIRLRVRSFLKEDYILCKAPDELSKIFEPESFKTVVLSEVIEHVEQPLDFILGCSKYVMKGGRILITVPDEWSWDPHKKPFVNNSHKHWFKEDDFLELLGKTNMKLAQFIHTKPEWEDGFVFFFAILIKE